MMSQKESDARWYAKHREKKLTWARQYRLDHLEEMRERDRDFRRRNPEKAVNDARAYRATINGKVKDNIARKLNYSLHGLKKSHSIMELTGCTLEFLRGYLESRFLADMTWENYGKFGWHIDHIRPCASFDLSDPEQQKICFHYTNLQPLWAKDNHSKGAKC
jgi:hypothetical protein